MKCPNCKTENDDRNYYFNTLKELNDILNNDKFLIMYANDASISFSEFFVVWFDGDFSEYLKENYTELKQFEEYINDKEEFIDVYFIYDDKILQFESYFGASVCSDDLNKWTNCKYDYTLTDYYESLLKEENAINGGIGA